MYILTIMMWDGIDQRKFPRAKHKCRINIRRGEKDELVETFTENIGAGGVCVVVDRAFEIFDNVKLELHIADGSEPINCNGTIVWVVRRHPVRGENIMEFDTGIEFADISEGDRSRVSRLVDSLLK